MEPSTTVSREQLIASVHVDRPHVVLLGAGASLAACPAGDRNGKKLPLMWNFTEVVPIAHLVPVEARGENFEAFYSRIATDPAEADRCREIERIVYDYFDSLELPAGPTIYDYLVLSLRPKDVIATFNWDPFLLQALRRNGRALGGTHPHLLFLHGSVVEGVCAADKVLGKKGDPCPKCLEPLQGTRLLYPVGKKDYARDEALSETWSTVERAFSKAFVFTVFGYGAPASDVEAVALLKRGWGDVEEREFEQIEVIDLRDEDALVASWSEFIHTHHYTVANDFFKSSLALNPRRSCEAAWHCYVEGLWTTPNPFPRDVSLSELQAWIRPLLDVEQVATD